MREREMKRSRGGRRSKGRGMGWSLPQVLCGSPLIRSIIINISRRKCLWIVANKILRRSCLNHSIYQQNDQMYIVQHCRLRGKNVIIPFLSIFISHIHPLKLQQNYLCWVDVCSVVLYHVVCIYDIHCFPN